MSNFDENVVTKLKRLEREIERLKVGESPAKDGWIPVSSTWTYASAKTITVPSGAASIYKVGQGIKLTQTTVKYFYIIGVTDTVLTITGGSDYTLANAAISAVSYTNTPHTAIGFPVWFNWTPTETGWTALPTGTYRYCMQGKMNTCLISMNAGTSDSTIAEISLPFQAAYGDTGCEYSGAVGVAFDNGVLLTTAARYTIASGGTKVTFYTNMGIGGWTASGTKIVFAMFSYEAL